VFAIGPGGGDARNQPLHRDDSIYHVKHTAATPESYEYGRDVAIGFFLAGKKTSKANGATRFIPGTLSVLFVRLDGVS
jgi:ectoine hydroxylase-related dioxygenase (phytanoyl-CoA dioxygenase family)